MKRVLFVVAAAYVAAAAVLPADVFYLGDGGVKAVQVQSLLATGFRTTTLVEPFPELHARGARFPLAPPFAYREDGRVRASFPPTFAMMSAPFFAAFGWRGLRVLPVAAALALLLLVARVGRALGFAPGAAAALAGLSALATPLALYAVQFWEHLPFVACVVGALGLAIEAMREGGNARRAIVGGALLGLSATLREEALVFVVVGAVGLAVVRGPARAWMAGALVGLAVVLVVNHMTTGHALGFHGLQLAADATRGDVGDRVAAHLARALVQLGWFVAESPVVLLALAGGLWSPRPSAPAGRFLRVVFVLSLAAIVVVSPNDGGTKWGPRYLLPELPLVVLLAAIATRDALARLRGPSAIAMRALVGGLFLWGAVAVGFGARSIAQELSGTSALVETLRADRADAVITANPWVARDLAALWFERPVLLVDRQDELAAAFTALRAAGRTHVAAVEWTTAPPGVPALAFDGAATREAIATMADYRLERWRLAP